MIKISVIVPCYNAEKFLRECINSILSQTLKEIEVICVNDGSTDGTQKILEEYRDNAYNVQILYQKNQGVGNARNYGIKMARGKYLAFMDADDFYPSKYTLEKIYSTAEEKKAEICGGSMCSYRNGVYTYEGFRKGFTFAEDSWIEKKDFPTMGGFTKFLFRSELIKKNEIFFPSYCRFEDPPFLMEAIASAERVYCLKEVTYVYRKEHKQFFYSQENAIDYIKGLKDCLDIARREEMQAVFLQIMNELHGEPSAIMYLYGKEDRDIRKIIHQINIMIRECDICKNKIPLLKEAEELDSYIENIEKEKQEFLNGLTAYRKIFLFGAGTIGKKVWAFLKKNNINVDAFVVSDVTQNATELDGLPIRSIDDYIESREQCKIIIATFPYLQEEIRKILQDKEFFNIQPFSLEKLYLYEGKVVH